MPGKRARRHFSQLREFERGLIIGMKTASLSTRRVAGQVDCSDCAVRNCWEQWTREGTHVRQTGSGATRKTTRREDRRIVRHLAEANLKSKCLFHALPLTSATAATVVPSQINVECHRLAKGPFLNGLPGAIFQQDNARRHTVRVAQDFLRHFQILPWPAALPICPL
ncbi:transposable element Tcb2 transposase [Trichonephila clavipes]|nr:transposable element Tcb2 transposase [Trichonephila clavipes]